MDLSYFITKRINNRKADSFTGLINNIAIASIGIGLAIMIISFLILIGFQEKIENKMISFEGHLQITKFNLSQSYEEEPISSDFDLFKNYSKIGFINHIQKFAHKAGLMKANDEVMGVLVKGVSNDFDIDKFSQNIVDGRFIRFNDSTYSKEILVSKIIANKLLLEIGDDPLVYFIQDSKDPIRVRPLKIVGIYETGLEDFDEKIIIGDLKLIQRINNWPDSLIGGVEVFINNFNKIDRNYEELVNLVNYDQYVEKISDKYVEIFDWLALLNRNVVIFLSLTLFVASFNMVSILLILIMERTQMIGTLKALGAQNKLIRKIFVYNGMILIAKGLMIGNLVGISFGIIQDKFKLIKLDPENYYMDFVPINWNWQIILSLNILTFLVVSLVLIIPTVIITRITPIKSIRFS